MDTTLDFIGPVPPEIFAAFVGLLVLATLYFGIKFVLSLVTGG